MKKLLPFLMLTLLFAPAAGWCEAIFLPEGTYVSSVMPTLTAESAQALESRISNIRGIADARANTQMSTVQFTVKPGQKVSQAAIQKAAAKAEPNATLSTPEPLTSQSSQQPPAANTPQQGDQYNTP